MASYRPNSALIFQRSDGRILICERAGRAGAWQFPQGGVDKGETHREAAVREGFEETGFRESDYDIVDVRGPYRYEYPEDVKKAVRLKRGESYAGQEQFYHLCRMRSDTLDPEVDGREFRAFRWIRPAEFEIAWLPPFKQAVYRQVLEDFFPSGR